MKSMKRLIEKLQRNVDRPWYGPLIGFLSWADNLVLIIPNDGILISSSMLVPKRWLQFAVCISVGSTLGALTLSLLTSYYGIPMLEYFYPNLLTSSAWMTTESFFKDYGLWVVLFVAMTPLVQQPAVVLATLAHTQLPVLLAVVFLGRMVKYLIMSWAASHSPKLLAKMWGVQGELKEVGVDPKAL